MSDIDEIKSRLEIVDVIGQYVPSLKRAGHSYKGLCPFHREKSPSFIVTPGMQIYKCFGCGEGGDVLKFIEKIERVSFGEALQIAADKAGYKLTQKYDKETEQQKKIADEILAINEVASKYWNYILTTHPAGLPGRSYAEKRQIRMEEITKFQLGYAPAGKGDNLTKFLVSKGFKQDKLIEAGMAVERSGRVVDKFRDRLILPIMNLKGQVIGFSGRQVTKNENSPKYLNSPETAVYKKGEILMGIYQAKEAARKANFVILEEGNIDLLSSHKVGVENIAATGGTALTLQQCKLIKRHADTVYFCFDTDQAGIKALIKGVELAEQIGLKHKALDIGDYQDPDQLISTEPAKWEEVISKPQNTITHLINVLQQGEDLGTADGKSEFFYKMLPILRSLKDPVQLQHYAGEVAVLAGITQDTVIQSLQKAEPEIKFAPQSVIVNKAKAPTQTSGETHHASTREIYMLGLLLQLDSPQQIEISQDVFQDVDCREVYTRIQKVDRLDSEFMKLAESLSDGARDVLQQALVIDLTEIADPMAELIRVYKILYRAYLRTQILELRNQLQREPENEQVLSQLSYLTKELNQLN